MSRLMCAMEQYLATPQLELRVLAMCLAEIVADELRPDQPSRAHTVNAQQSTSESVWPTLEFQVCTYVARFTLLVSNKTQTYG